MSGWSVFGNGVKKNTWMKKESTEMKIDVEWRMVMEKVGKGRESENRRRARLVKCSER